MKVREAVRCVKRVSVTGWGMKNNRSYPWDSTALTRRTRGWTGHSLYIDSRPGHRSTNPCAWERVPDSLFSLPAYPDLLFSSSSPTLFVYIKRSNPKRCDFTHNSTHSDYIVHVHRGVLYILIVLHHNNLLVLYFLFVKFFARNIFHFIIY